MIRSKDSVGKDLVVGRTESTGRKGTQRMRCMQEVMHSTGRTLAELKEMTLNRNI